MAKLMNPSLTKGRTLMYHHQFEQLTFAITCGAIGAVFGSIMTIAVLS